MTTNVIVFTPSACLPTPGKKGADGTVAPDAPPAYTGTVTLRPPTYDERIALYDLTAALEGTNKYGFVARLSKELPKFLLAVDITRVDDGYKFASLADMDLESDLMTVISDSVTRLMEKYRVGNATPTT